MARQRLLTDEHWAGLPILPLDERDIMSHCMPVLERLNQSHPIHLPTSKPMRKGQTSELQLVQRGSAAITGATSPI